MFPVVLAAAPLIYGGKKLLDYFKSPSVLPASDFINNSVADHSYTEEENTENDNSKITLINNEQERAEQELAEIDKNLNISLASMGAAGAGRIFFSPLTHFGVAGLGYLTMFDIMKVRDTWIKEKKIKFEAINSILIIGLLSTGYVCTAGFSYFVYFMGQKLLFKAQDHNKKNLANIFESQQRSVWLVIDDAEIEISMDSLKPGDIISVKAGETIPVDGTVTIGNGLADQQILTGESRPVEKGAGDLVFASTVLLAGKICIKVEKSGKDTVASNIENILKSTADFKTSAQLKAERVSEKAVWPTIAFSIAALPIAGAVGSLAILYSFAGYDIRIFAHLSMLNFMKAASRNGILIKDGRAIELLDTVDTVIFDKTGTLTSGEPHVFKIHPCLGYEESEVLQYAAIAENRQTHPIAKAILSKAEEFKYDKSFFTKDQNKECSQTESKESNQGQSKDEQHDIIYEIGYGIKVKIGSDLIFVGSSRFMQMENITIPSDIEELMEICHTQGYSLIMVAKNHHLAGVVELHTSVRPEAQTIIRQLKERNKTIYMISGDYDQVAKVLADELGIENYIAEAAPEQKSDIIEKLQNQGKKVCFIGDGINDSIAMKKANVSVSLSGASQIATDTANIILLDGTLNNLDKIFDMSEYINKNLKVAMNSAIVPGILNIGSVLFLHTGIISSVVVDNVGMLTGIANGYMPLKKYPNSNSNSKNENNSNSNSKMLLIQ